MLTRSKYIPRLVTKLNKSNNFQRWRCYSHIISDNNHCHKHWKTSNISSPTITLQSCGRFVSTDGIGRGTDLLADSLAFSARPKIIFDGYTEETGFDVLGMPDVDKETVVHMNGSVLAFPHACYLWKPKTLKEVTFESLTAVMLHDPPLEFLFLGCKGVLPPRELNKIQREFRAKGIHFEKTDPTNTMATFNILNGEDRPVAAAILLEGGNQISDE